jgi:vacuolar-type H+-ATPase subunit H
MRQAGKQAQQNQTSQAQRSQQQAEEALEEMLKDLDQVNQNREEQLRRTLASVIETLDGLIRQQEGELGALDAAVKNKAGLAGLDAGMIRLNQNTLGALDLIREGGAEIAPVASLVSRASDAQGSAITELRRPILGATMVREFENRSLNLLTQARDKAKEIEEKAGDREERRKMGELRKAYRAILERQTAIVDETKPLAEAAELSRRDRSLARALGERQETLRLDLAELLSKSQDLQSAKVFDHQHKRLDGSAQRAVAGLNDGEPKRSRPAQDAVVAGLRAIIEALNDPKREEDKFSQGPQEGGGGGGQGGGKKPLIDNLKELRLLRAMQQSLALSTADLSAGEGRPPRAVLQELAEDQRSLMRIGEELLNRMQGAQNPEQVIEQQIGPGRPNPDQPGEPKDGEPKPEAPKDGGDQ